MALLLTNEKVVLYPNKNDIEFNYKLPAQNAVIIAFNIKANSVSFAQQEILIGRDTNVKLDLQPSSKQAIQQALEKIEEGYE